MIRKSKQSRVVLLVIFIVSLIATTWSLYLSEGLGLVPCELCWYQRILMYPIVLISVGGILKQQLDFSASIILVMSLIGSIISGYHSYIQIGIENFSCSSSTSCTVILYQFYGLSIPNLSFIAFCIILISSIIIKLQKGEKYKT